MGRKASWAHQRWRWRCCSGRGMRRGTFTQTVYQTGGRLPSHSLRLAWRRYQKGLINENAQLKVPAELSPGAARLVFAAGVEIDNLERRCGDGLPPTEVKELVPWLNARASNRQRGLFLVRAMDTQSQGSRRALSDAWCRCPKTGCLLRYAVSGAKCPAKSSARVYRAY